MAQLERYEKVWIFVLISCTIFVGYACYHSPFTLRKLFALVPIDANEEIRIARKADWYNVFDEGIKIHKTIIV